MNSRLSRFLALGALIYVDAFPSYRLQIPNGLRVACPPAAEGCGSAEFDVEAAANNRSQPGPSCVCSAIGHRTCQGGTLPLNPFGLALRAARFAWTRELCEADSDGDGLTNGEELGDPCCLWEASDSPSDYTRTYAATHPGVKNDPAEKARYVRPDCQLTVPKAKTAKLNRYNPGEQQRTQEMYISNYTIPPAPTTYVNFAWNFDDESQDVFHAVYAEVILRNPRFLHHFVLLGCPNKWPVDKVGKEVSMMEGGCFKLIGEWAPGKDIIAAPVFLGVPIGRGAGVSAFLVSVHYNNPGRVAGVVSTDGMRVHYTPTLRSQTLTTLDVMRLSMNPSVAVPPNKTRWFVTRSCNVTLAKTSPSAPEAWNLALAWYHGHLLSREMHLVLRKPDGRAFDLGSDRYWSFDDQYTRNLLPLNLTLQTEDVLEATCVYDSRQSAGPVYFGSETTDEMCWAEVRGWPDSVVPQCSGALWAGELQGTEPGQLTQQRHPLAQAAHALDGSNTMSGGSLLKGGWPLGTSPQVFQTAVLPSVFVCQAASAPVPISGAPPLAASALLVAALWPLWFLSGSV